MHKTNLSYANMKETILSDSILTEANLSYADIKDAYFGKSPDFT